MNFFIYSITKQNNLINRASEIEEDQNTKVKESNNSKYIDTALAKEIEAYLRDNDIDHEDISYCIKDLKHNITYSKRGTLDMCDSLLNRLGLEKYRNTKAGSLSGGEQQRVALGRALYSKPTILLLDEPLSALDWNLRKQVREDLVSIIREWNVPCVWVTHDESEAEAVGDKHWTCENGQIIIP